MIAPKDVGAPLTWPQRTLWLPCSLSSYISSSTTSSVSSSSFSSYVINLIFCIFCSIVSNLLIISLFYTVLSCTNHFLFTTLGLSIVQVILYATVLTTAITAVLYIYSVHLVNMFSE